ncbi:hypothetical protein [Streptomyces virginiae]|uniref:hypothetical protein n=1 Tax=Streptomyces virginiae TaxID=1961 RepID=UPI0022574E17|nr:hypothetical protein [Streptomyces virginiae]MCX4715949.1 hypothetical protein [Streptomyces virginiae]MCX5273693.1 hypothetical protein [Streptomyces virginiae]
MSQHVERPELDQPQQITPSPRRLGGQENSPGPSQDLLDRARVGWERFVSSIQEPSDD